MMIMRCGTVPESVSGAGMMERDFSYAGILMNKMTTFAAAMFVLLTACATGFAAVLAEPTLESVKQDLAAGKAVLLDVREVDEWNDGHLQDARPLPLSQVEKGIDAKQLEAVAPAGKIIYLHCAAGARSQVAAKRLKASGRDLRPLTQGYDDLLRAGFTKAPR
jgi:phage shock protein E